VAPDDHIRAVPTAQGGVAPSWLHDQTLQALEYIASGGYRDDVDVEHLRDVAAQAADELREVLERRRRPARDLVTALADVVARAQVLSGPLQIFLTVDELDRPVPPHLVETLAGAVTESLTNVRKHAGARHAFVRCIETPDAIVVTVADDGRGFEAALDTIRMGVRDSIIGRMTAAGGTAIVESRPGDGTRVTLHLPTTRRPVAVPQLARSAS
jgi:signal transduction histidine kinase